jgi:hypothetical protein
MNSVRESFVRRVRSQRVPAPGTEVRFGWKLGRLVDISATGALARVDTALGPGKEYPLVLRASDDSVRLTVRVVRVVPEPVALPGATSRLKQYLLGLAFTVLPPDAEQAVASLCGPAFTEKE